MTFLELCQAVRQECGITGTGPASVISQTGMHGKIVDWVKQADLHIQGLYHDWNFMWAEASLDISAANDTVVQPNNFYHAEPNTFMLDDGTTKSPMSIIPYKDLKDRIKYQSSTAKPDALAIKPTGNFKLSAIPDNDYTLTFDYYKIPTEMSGNTSVSLIPEQHHRLIVLKAKIYYAEHEEADALVKYIAPEYTTLMSKLVSDQLPGENPHWIGQNEEIRVIPE